jgi:hypothetical protein
MWDINSLQTISSCPLTCNDLLTMAINFCGTVRPNQTKIRKGFGLKLKIE